MGIIIIELARVKNGLQVFRELALYMDGLIHNRYDPLDSNDLLYDYEKIFRAFTEHLCHCMLQTEGSVPSHLTTLEFTDLISGLLNYPGYFIVNCVDIFSLGKLLNAYLNTVGEVFPCLSVYSSSGVLLDRRDTFVVIAGNNKVDQKLLTNSMSGYTFSMVDESDLAELSARFRVNPFRSIFTFPFSVTASSETG